jgi:hypothetical protein
VDNDRPAPPPPKRKPYQKPKIVWREPYRPMTFGISCAKQPGNPGCGSGPFSS